MIIYLETAAARGRRRASGPADRPEAPHRPWRGEGVDLLRDSLTWLVPVEMSIEHLLDRLEAPR
ncbi:hypothetical protein FDP22_08980 [Paroceanicella profunda]|uniref:Uncharacterized protein n=1 Tax=Paroceanicella profunda TaxID=2579971 RepID=A0A5B8FH86_9RHOB|nr:hypothetical protein [Paroceanicella profunda]QDL91897.1 hypothetical protein FDP22_08980 [Paroceanicella profunda]